MNPAFRLRPELIAPLALLLFVGCRPGSLPDGTLDRLVREDGWIIVRGVHGIRQVGPSDCGAAALGMVLEFWGQARRLGEIKATLLAPRHRGIQARALRDYARRRGLAAFLIEGHHTDLITELQAGRPMIVGLWKDSIFGAFPHYEVVVGIHPVTRRIIAFDPDSGFRTDTWDHFSREWTASGSVGLVILPPGLVKERATNPSIKPAPNELPQNDVGTAPS